MALDATQPADGEFLSEVKAIIRETREAINVLESGMGAAATTTVSTDSTSLGVGSDLSESSIEVVFLSGTGAITTITAGVNGMIKIFVCDSSDLSFVHDGSGIVGGVLRLNSGTDLDITSGDVIAFVNVGGVTGGSHGYWREILRTLQGV